jgi:hypothetical protein
MSCTGPKERARTGWPPREGGKRCARSPKIGVFGSRSGAEANTRRVPRHVGAFTYVCNAQQPEVVRRWLQAVRLAEEENGATDFPGPRGYYFGLSARRLSSVACLAKSNGTLVNAALQGRLGGGVADRFMAHLRSIGLWQRGGCSLPS